MKWLEVIFVRSGDHPLIESIIEKVTGSLYTHAAIRIDIEGKSRMVEAKMPSFLIRDGSVYDHCQTICCCSIPLTSDQHQAVVNQIFNLVGKSYGIDDCIQGGIKDLFGFGKSKESELAQEFSVNCSQAALHIIRAAFPHFMEESVADTVTPEVLRQEVMREWGAEKS